MLKSTGKSFSVKDWFANKVANEVKSNISMCEVFAILKETEKAVYAVLNLGYFFHKTMWIPKSALIENETHYDHETWQFDSYDEAIYAFKAMWEMYA